MGSTSMGYWVPITDNMEFVSLPDTKLRHGGRHWLVDIILFLNYIYNGTQTHNDYVPKSLIKAQIPINIV